MRNHDAKRRGEIEAATREDNGHRYWNDPAMQREYGEILSRQTAPPAILVEPLSCSAAVSRSPNRSCPNGRGGPKATPRIQLGGPEPLSFALAPTPANVGSLCSR